MSYLLLSDEEIRDAYDDAMLAHQLAGALIAHRQHAKIRQALDDFIIKYRNDDAESILKGLNALVDRMEAK